MASLASGRLRWFAAAGMALGVACMFRPDYLLYPSFLLIGALAVLPWRRALAGSAVLTLVTALAGFGVPAADALSLSVAFGLVVLLLALPGAVLWTAGAGRPTPR